MQERNATRQQTTDRTSALGSPYIYVSAASMHLFSLHCNRQAVGPGASIFGSKVGWTDTSANNTAHMISNRIFQGSSGLPVEDECTQHALGILQALLAGFPHTLDLVDMAGESFLHSR